jgi:hypothetical protein
LPVRELPSVVGLIHVCGGPVAAVDGVVWPSHGRIDCTEESFQGVISVRRIESSTHNISAEEISIVVPEHIVRVSDVAIAIGPLTIVSSHKDGSIFEPIEEPPRVSPGQNSIGVVGFHIRVG